MSERNELTARRYLDEIWSDGNLGVIEEIIAPNIVFVGPTGALEGRDAFSRYVQGIHALFPDIHFANERQLLSGQMVVSQWTMTGTHTNDFMGIPATGRPFSVRGVSVLEFSGGQVANVNLYWDRLDLAGQLGASLNPTGNG